MPLPKNKKNDQYIILNRRQNVAKLYLEGNTQTEISTKLRVSQATISSDLTAIRKQWLEKSVRDFDTRKSEELAKLDALERTLRLGYERSCQEVVTSKSKTEKSRQHQSNAGRGRRPGSTKLVPVRTTTESNKRTQCGDVRFLEQIKDVIVLRLRLMGELKATNNINVTTIDWNVLAQNIPLEGNVPDEIEQEVRKALTLSAPQHPDEQSLPRKSVTYQNVEEHEPNHSPLVTQQE